MIAQLFAQIITGVIAAAFYHFSGEASAFGFIGAMITGLYFKK